MIIGGELGKYSEEMTGFVNDKIKLKSSYMEYEGTRIIFSDLDGPWFVDWWRPVTDAGCFSL